jgi:hypothetical protein
MIVWKRRNSMTQAVVLTFKTYEEPLTLAKRLEVKAIDIETEFPVVSLPLTEMAAWLRTEGFQWLSGSSGIWERAA